VGRRDLRRVLHGVLADAAGEELDRHDAEHRMAALPGPVGVGKGREQPRRLLVLAGDRIEKRSRRLDRARGSRAGSPLRRSRRRRARPRRGAAGSGARRRGRRLRARGSASRAPTTRPRSGSASAGLAARTRRRVGARQRTTESGRRSRGARVSFVPSQREYSALAFMLRPPTNRFPLTRVCPEPHPGRHVPGMEGRRVRFLIAVFGWGFGFYGIGVFLAELVERHGWATSSVASAVTVLYLVGAVLIAFVGNAFERFGPRRVVLAGISSMGAAAIGLTWITHPWQLYVVFPLMAVGWAAMSGAALNIIVAPWFERRRGLGHQHRVQRGGRRRGPRGAGARLSHRANRIQGRRAVPGRGDGRSAHPARAVAARARSRGAGARTGWRSRRTEGNRKDGERKCPAGRGTSCARGISGRWRCRLPSG
jgi:hypothetical protein